MIHEPKDCYLPRCWWWRPLGYVRACVCGRLWMVSTTTKKHRVTLEWDLVDPSQRINP